MISRSREYTCIRGLIVGTIVLALAVGLGQTWSSAGEEGGLRFSHRSHIQEYEVDCEACHAGASSSEAGEEDLLAAKDVCAECHDVESSEECSFCHRESPPAERLVRITDYSRKFSHAKHLGDGVECSACHAGVETKESIGELHLPGMPECMACHRSKKVSVECLVCHSRGEDLRPADHRFDWIHAHQDFAGSQEEGCNDCHWTDQCQECHQGDNLFERTHPANFEFDHGLQARGQEHECSACHEASGFCAPCHLENMVVSHPLFDPEWANPTDGGRHRDEAEHNLDYCIACHDQPSGDPVCARCHER